MLVLTRKKDQSIIIDGKIEVVILDVSGESVKIGVRAPREIAVYRKELYEAIREENIKAASAEKKLPDGLADFFKKER